MKKIQLLIILLIASISIIVAQEQDSSAIYANTIIPGDIQKHLYTLASDEMEGRETGQQGQKLAAEYIAGEFKKLDLSPINEETYFQKINFAYNRWENISLKVKDEYYRYMWDFYAFPSSNKNVELLNIDEVVFLGYGIDDEKYSDYNGVDVKGKTIIIYQGEPLSKDSISYITGEKKYSDWALDWRKKLETAKRKGVELVLFIEPDINERVSRYRDRLLNGQMTKGTEVVDDDNYANSIYISRKIAKEIIGNKFYKKFIKSRDKIRAKGISKNLSMSTQLEVSLEKEQKIIEGENVLGFMEGKDPTLKDDIIVVSAHYDHLGKRGEAIYNGADDNGSGTSTVLEIAEAFSIAKKEGFGPRRSILFLLVSGEEKGLLGSEYYADYPIYSLENTIANVNVDMIGRTDKNHEDNPNYIYVIGADRLSTELHDINEYANRTYTQIELDYTFNERDDPNRFYYRSDHYNFAKNGIPSIFYFSGVHDDYHMVTDTAEKINYEKTTIIGKLIFHTIWQLANQDKTIEVNVFEEE